MAGQGLIGRRRTAPGRASEERREICLAGRQIPYVLRRSDRRTLGLQVSHHGVKVGVPRPTADLDVEAFIRSHQDWLLEKLVQHESRRTSGEFAIADGAMLPVFGEHCRIRAGAVGRAISWRLGVDGIEELHLPRAGNASAHLTRALRRRALPWFGERVAEYCFRLGLPVPAVRLSSARTRWGSCSARSGIRLHWRLIHLPPLLIDYVVAHEVAHLLEMNHSPRFWSVVERLYPQWRDARSRLKVAGPLLPVFGSGGGEGSVDED
ncbi:MAG TPA: SprT family zinc-dependent metalloprotease [Aromatoleum sp.]|uniref:M48 family metallopeptidase n=1 Tax=Aromatoleum sp. TaxID=2307007 RepID=UPI002B4A84F1|nr:SprT family zinc-dependent metalloprotease [Aromatoleum sp.]HJV28302.1 SprT family zinc-dependent metalloprotease [Aromatoleum sp.]